MNVAPILAPVMHALVWLIPLAVITGVVKSSWFKGVVGEATVRFSAKLYLSSKDYPGFHNVTLMTDNGTTQIDHVFVSRFGIFVIETKNMTGWIFGQADQAMWTQKIYRQSYRFQNPLRQNYKHTQAIEAALEVSADQVFSVVVFVGGSTFKTPMPPNVTYGGEYISFIKSKQTVVFSQAQVARFCEVMASGRIAPSLRTSREHVKELKRRHANKR